MADQQQHSRPQGRPSEQSRPQASDEQQQGRSQQGEGTREHEMRQAPPKPPNILDEAAKAAEEALVAQQDAQDAAKRAYAMQLAAQEKAQQAAPQLEQQKEMANRVAMVAAKEAAEKAAQGQRGMLEQQFSQRRVAEEAARNAVAAIQDQPAPAGNQQAQQPPPPTAQQPTISIVNPVALPGASPLPAFGQPSPDLQQQGVAAQGFVMQAANSAASEAQAQMTGAQQLAANSQDPASQQKAAQEASIAQQKMQFAQELAAAAQSPQSALSAAAYLSGSQAGSQ